VITTLLAQAGAEGPDRIRVPDVEWSAIAPELCLIVGALVLVMFAGLSRWTPPAGTYAAVTLTAGAGALATAARLWDDISEDGPRTAIAGAVAVDGFSVFFMVAIGVAVILGALLADGYLRREGLHEPEFYILMLLSAAGGMTMAAANDLVVLFLGLEILSIALYVLAGFHARRGESQEAALKYFILGAFSSAFLLYGIALVYGATGSTNLGEISVFLRENTITSSGVFLAGIALVLVGLGFKVAAVPFHMWTPDVYQGAPTPATGFMAAAAKAAGFAALLRLFFSTFGLYVDDWQPVVTTLAILTLAIGSVVALVQTDIKRMLAYSSISHAGYVLLGLQAASARGIAGALFYLLAYTFMVIGSFGVVTLVGRRGDADHDLDAYRGLAGRRPGLALTFTVLLLAQAGVPLTTGFLAKFYVIAAVVEKESYVLAVVAMAAAVVAAFFYLRVIVLMYMTGEATEEARPPVPMPVGAAGALAVSLAFTLVFGVLPDSIVDFAEKATLLAS
jgi:NADH-quinone oxidoreductase subunit N